MVLDSPDRLLKKKPFTRGGSLNDRNTSTNINITSKLEASFSLLKLNEITQDTYLREYDPSLHQIIFNRSIPHIAVKVGDQNIVIDDMTETAAYQKNIHAAHVLHLTAKDMEFTLCNSPKNKKQNLISKISNLIKGNSSEEDDITARFQELKQEWLYRDMKSVMSEVVSKQKK